jgi:UDP-N-acetylmuramate--alanine ligase
MKQHIHLIGIGGTGLSAIARLLHESGYVVSGSDQSHGPLADALARDGIAVYIGHRAENIAGADVIVRSSAVSADNPEVAAAIAAGIPVLKRSEFLGQLMREKTVIAIAGTHGKTTTTGLTAYMLHQLGLDPSFIVGGTIQQLGTNAHAGTGDFFVIEADEYDRMFLGLNPSLAVITYLEHDHPDIYPTFAEYRQAFFEFASSIRAGGSALVCGDQPELRAFSQELVSANIPCLTYGCEEWNDYQARNIRLSPEGFYTLDVWYQHAAHTAVLAYNVTLSLPGKHNIQNALAALAAAHIQGVDMKDAAPHVAAFTGTGRRFEITSVVNGITLIDDYAHHPTEIQTTLAAVRSRFQQARIYAIWQPHTYSRTRLLRTEFTHAFSQADQVFITEIYASREPKEEFSSRELVREMDPASTRYVNLYLEVIPVLTQELRPGDVVIVLSAGDAVEINPRLAAELKGVSHA